MNIQQFVIVNSAFLRSKSFFKNFQLFYVSFSGESFFLSREHKKIFYTYSRPMFTDRNIFEDSYQLVKHFSLFSSSVSTELLPLIKSYYLKEAIQYYRKVKSKKCFTNQEESSKLFLSVLPLTSKALEDTAVISPRVLEFIRLK